MLVKDLPEQVSNKTFNDLWDLVAFVYDNQLVTEYWELSVYEINDKMKKDLEEARKLKDSDFINLK